VILAEVACRASRTVSDRCEAQRQIVVVGAPVAAVGTRSVLVVLSVRFAVVATRADLGLVGSRWAIGASWTGSTLTLVTLIRCCGVRAARALVLPVVQSSGGAVVARFTIGLQSSSTGIRSACWTRVACWACSAFIWAGEPGVGSGAIVGSWWARLLLPVFGLLGAEVALLAVIGGA
jgi:hypothetical protein